jgi:steroid delta-isomerase-like uncharacterized protein
MGATETRDAAARALIAEWDGAWAARDADALAACMTEDATWADPLLTRPLRGRAEVRAYCAAMLRSLPDIEVRQEELLLDADHDDATATRWSVRGTFRQDFDGGGFASMPTAATGDRVDFGGVALMTMRDGRIASLRQYTDYVTFQRQIGALPPQGSRGERALAALQRLGAARRRRRNG